MKLRTTFLLVILNAVVFFFLLRQESPFQLKDQMGKEEVSILPLPMTEATGIEVSGSGVDTPYSLKLDNGSWKITQPIEWDANMFAVRRMISRLEAAEVSVRFPVSDIQTRHQSLSDFGLENPNIQVTVVYGDQKYEYDFGAPVEINNQLYMLGPSKEEILVVKSGLVQPFLLGVDALRSHHLFSIPVFEIRSLLVEFNDDSSRRRFTHDQGNWVIDSPFLADANDERVQGAIDQLVNFEVDMMIPASSADSIQDVTQFNAIARFEIIGNRRNSTLLVSQYFVNGEVNPTLYQARFEGSSTRFLIPRSEIDWWRNSQSSLRERRFININPLTVSKVEIMKSGETPSILRLLKLENNQWRIYSGQGVAELADYQGDPAVITETLSDLNDLVILSFADDNPTPEALVSYGLADPWMTVTLESDTSVRLFFGVKPDQNTQVYVKAEGSDSVYQVASEIVSDLSLDPLDYRARSIPLTDADTKLSGFRLIDRSNGHITDATSASQLTKTAIQPLTDENSTAIIAAVNVLLSDFRASGYLDAAFSENQLKYGGIVVDLPFDFELVTASGDTIPDIMKMSYRLSGTELLAWLPKQQVAVKLQQQLIDVIFPLIYKTSVPEEWSPAATETNGTANPPSVSEIKESEEEIIEKPDETGVSAD